MVLLTSAFVTDPKLDLKIELVNAIASLELCMPEIGLDLISFLAHF